MENIKNFGRTFQLVQVKGQNILFMKKYSGYFTNKLNKIKFSNPYLHNGVLSLNI